MALNFAQSAALMNNLDFRGRVKVAALQYATALLAQPGSSNSKASWVQRTMQQPDTTAQVLVPAVVLNVNVQNAGADITDQDLAAAVQATADKMM